MIFPCVKHANTKYTYTNTQIHKYSIWRSVRKTQHVVYFWRGGCARLTKIIFPCVKHANTKIQIHTYKNTAYDQVPETPNMWHIFEKRIVQGYQKWHFHVSDMQIQKYKYTNTQIHKYTNTQIHKYTNTQIHKYTNTQIQIQVKLDDVTFASLVQRSRFKPGGKMREGYFCFSYLRFRPRCTHSASASYSRDEGFSFPSRLFSKFSMRAPWPTLWCSRQSRNPTKS